MSGDQDEGRAARILKYKEERRKQLTARSAALFSANVTERKSKKVTNKQLSEDTNHLKASSEISLDAATTSSSIKSTRTSRLRAAAAIQDAPKKANRSSSVNSRNVPDDVKNRTARSVRIIERDKRTANRRQSREEKENVKTSPVQKDIGAIKTKPKHSIVKLDKDKRKNLVTSSKRKAENATVKVPNGGLNAHLEEVKHEVVNLDESLKVNGEEILEELLNDSSEKDQFEELFNDLVENKVQDAVTLNLNDGVPDDLAVNLSVDNELNSISQKVQVPSDVHKVVKENGINANSQEIKVPVVSAFQDLVRENWHNAQSHKDQNPSVETPQSSVENVAEDSVSVVPVNKQVSLLSVTCVRKVERFSELLSNLCSPCEADILFEDILAENGLENKEEMRLAAPACAPPCRRAQPPRVASTPRRAPPTSDTAPAAAAVEAEGAVNKINWGSFEYMTLHSNLANNEFSGPMGSERLLKEWGALSLVEGAWSRHDWSSGGMIF